MFSSSPAQPLLRPLSYSFFFSFDLPIFTVFFYGKFHISFKTSPFTILLSSWNSFSLFQSHVSSTLHLPFLPPHSISFVISLPRRLLHSDLFVPLSPSFSSFPSLDLTFSNSLLPTLQLFRITSSNCFLLSLSLILSLSILHTHYILSSSSASLPLLISPIPVETLLPRFCPLPYRFSYAYSYATSLCNHLPHLPRPILPSFNSSLSLSLFLLLSLFSCTFIYLFPTNSFSHIHSICFLSLYLSL